MAFVNDFVAFDLCASVQASSHAELMNCVCRFFDESLSSQSSGYSLDDKEGHVTATVFLDYAPLDFEAHTYTECDDVAVVVLKHPSRRDIVRWHRVFDLLIEYLQRHGLKVDGGHQAGAGAIFYDDFDDDMSSGSEADDYDEVAETVEMLLTDLEESTNDTQRAECFQYLARWASSTTAYRTAVANGFAKHAFLFGTTFSADSLTSSLEEMYPAASALRMISHEMSPEVYDILPDSQLLKSLATIRMSDLPPLVERELSKATNNLQIAAHTKLFGGKIDAVDLSSASTRYTASTIDGTQFEDLGDLDDDTTILTPQ